jgi:hypothetical protein
MRRGVNLVPHKMMVYVYEAMSQFSTGWLHVTEQRTPLWQCLGALPRSRPVIIGHGLVARERESKT